MVFSNVRTPYRMRYCCQQQNIIYDNKHSDLIRGYIA